LEADRAAESGGGGLAKRMGKDLRREKVRRKLLPKKIAHSERNLSGFECD
jgi:hypothetical protein